MVTNRQSEILGMIRKRGGSIRTTEAKRLGISPGTLYKLEEIGEVEMLGRGVFRLAGLPDDDCGDLVRVASRMPRGVFCLETALHFHGLLTETPEAVHIAVPPTTRTPVFQGLSVVVHRLIGEAFAGGVEKCRKGGVSLKYYCAEKTLADCFRFRSKVGIERCVQALRRYCERPGADLEKVRGYAKRCRVESVMRPYLEALSL